jgi:methylated-DNA-protein-cysteine methyltransferase related protein
MPGYDAFFGAWSSSILLRDCSSWAVLDLMAPKAPRARDSAARKRGANSFERIRQVVLKIPRGHVMTYGDVAAAAGMPGAARTAGYAMRALGRTVPWQRVLGRRDARSAHITIRDLRGRAEQRRLLEQEGVRFDARGGIRLADFGWKPSRLKNVARRG